MNDLIEVSIDKIVAGGSGLGRHDGRVVFVPLAAPGDRLLVEVVDRRRDFWRGEVREILEASPDRRAPPCPYYASCGGCALMHLAPEAQARVKRDIVLESLKRGAHLDLAGRDVVVHTGPELRYRNRSRFHVTARGGRVVAGFHARASHRVVDVEHCLLSSESGNRVLTALRAWLGSHPERAKEIDEVEIWEESGGAVLHFLVSRDGGARLEETLGLDGVSGVVVTARGTERASYGKRHVTWDVRGTALAAGVGTFFQVNRFLVETLVDEVVGRGDGGTLAWDRALDLFCGVGLFTLPLGARAREVVGVESQPDSLRDARENARRAGVWNASFVEETAEAYVRHEPMSRFDVVVMDPPRGGLDPEVISALIAAPPPAIRYVSCDPPALARDLGFLVRSGFTLTRLAVLDFFPNTHHVEAVATLSRI